MKDCSRENLVLLTLPRKSIHGSFQVYRVRFSDSKTEQAAIPSMLREMIPVDLMKVQSSNEWKRAIVTAYNREFIPSVVFTYFLQNLEVTMKCRL
jgi:hypothetical protein